MVEPNGTLVHCWTKNAREAIDVLIQTLLTLVQSCLSLCVVLRYSDGAHPVFLVHGTSTLTLIYLEVPAGSQVPLPVSDVPCLWTIPHQ